MVTKAVGTKAALYDKVAGTPDISSRRVEVANVFEVRGLARSQKCMHCVCSRSFFFFLFFFSVLQSVTTYK